MFTEYDDTVPEMPAWLVALWTPISHGDLYEPPIPAPVWQDVDWYL